MLQAFRGSALQISRSSWLYGTVEVEAHVLSPNSCYHSFKFLYSVAGLAIELPRLKMLSKIISVVTQEICKLLNILTKFFNFFILPPDGIKSVVAQEFMVSITAIMAHIYIRDCTLDLVFVVVVVLSRDSCNMISF